MNHHEKLLDVRLGHAHYEAARRQMMDAIDMARGLGGAPIPLLGPTRCGKTELLKELLVDLDDQIKGPELRIPKIKFGLCPVPPKPNEAALYRAMLEAIGHAWKAKGFDGLRTRLIDVIRYEGTEVIVLDECNHCVESGANLNLRTTGDIFKQITDETGVVLILAGLPKFQRVIDGNEQLAERSLGSIHLLPYQWSDGEERQCYADAVFKIFDAIEDGGVELDLDTNDLATRLYGQSGGRIGPVLRVLKAALRGIRGDTLRAGDVRNAARKVSQKPSEAQAYWGPDAPTDTQLMLSYKRVMNEAGWEPRALSQKELRSWDDL